MHAPEHVTDVYVYVYVRMFMRMRTPRWLRAEGMDSTPAPHAHGRLIQQQRAKDSFTAEIEAPVALHSTPLFSHATVCQKRSRLESDYSHVAG